MNPKDIMGLKKVPLHLMAPAGLIHEAMCMGDGAVKYGPFNWRDPDKKITATVYIAAAGRHLLAWLDGEENAADSGRHHLGHAKATLGILLDAQACDNLDDDRPPPGATARLLKEFEVKTPVALADLRPGAMAEMPATPARGCVSDNLRHAVSVIEEEAMCWDVNPYLQAAAAAARLAFDLLEATTGEAVEAAHRVFDLREKTS